MAKRKSSAGLPPEINISINTDTFNEAFLPYAAGIWSYEVYYGGRGSGKSEFVADKFVLQLSDSRNSGRNLMCLRKAKNDARNSMFPQIQIALKKFKLLDLWEINKTDLHMTCLANNNEISFGGMDDVENVKSYKYANGNMTDLWYEEATEEYDMRNMRQLRDSMRDPVHKCRMVFTFNPVAASHPIKEFIEKELLPTGDCVYLKTTYKDNKFLPPDYGAKLESSRYTDPYSYMVNALGEWGITGQSVFDSNTIYKRMEQLGQVAPPFRGRFLYDVDDKGYPETEDYRLVSDPHGDVYVYKSPEVGHPYVVAHDPSGEGDDFSAAHVMDNTTGEQVAVYHSRALPTECVYQVYFLCRYYNNALYAPEINFSPSEVAVFRQLKYRKFYQRGKPIDNYSDGVEQKLGFNTNAGNRQAMILDCVSWVNQNIDKINDIATLEEMLVFTRQEKRLRGIFMGAEPGSHDDLVMAFAILLQAREQQNSYISHEMEEIEGTWLPIELESALLEGRITKAQKREYEKKHPRLSSPNRPGWNKEKRKVNPYDR